MTKSNYINDKIKFFHVDVPLLYDYPLCFSHLCKLYICITFCAIKRKRKRVLTKLRQAAHTRQQETIIAAIRDCHYTKYLHLLIALSPEAGGAYTCVLDTHNFLSNQRAGNLTNRCVETTSLTSRPWLVSRCDWGVTFRFWRGYIGGFSPNRGRGEGGRSTWPPRQRVTWWSLISLGVDFRRLAGLYTKMMAAFHLSSSFGMVPNYRVV